MNTIQSVGTRDPLQHSDLISALAAADIHLKGDGMIADRLERAMRELRRVDPAGLSESLRDDFVQAMEAMAAASCDDLSGVAAQYLRLVHTTTENVHFDRLFFTIWNRTGEEAVEPCLMLCRVNARNLDLLKVTRSPAFVQTVADRLGAKSYPSAILSSRMQGIEIIASAGRRPHVLFADFVMMGTDSGIDPASAGGLLFDSFGDLFLQDMRFVEKMFPNVVEWFMSRALLNKPAIRLLATGHVQAHDLCGHSVPYSLRDPVRSQADWFLRAPLEEYYADTQAMWIYSAASTRPLLSSVLSETELDAIPLMVAMKRLTFYAMKPADDHDGRCSWMMFSYWRKSGLIQRIKGKADEYFFDIENFPLVIDQMLSDILYIENRIADGVAAYEAACREFSLRYGYENPVTNRWEMPDDLANILVAN